MPIPLRPVGTGKENGQSPSNQGYFSFSPSQLNDLTGFYPMTKEAAASDVEASSLFTLWQKSTITKAAERIMDRVYDIPSDFNQNEILRLKTSGFLIKKENGIGFTDKAEKVIKTMVLGEENSLQRSAVDKPYSLILAESKSPKRSSGLTHTASTNHVPVEKKDVIRTSGLVKLSMASNIPIPGSDRPDDDSVFIYNERVVSTKNGSSKEYNVRVYDNGDGTYDVWAWNGRINGTMIPQPKGRYSSKSSALYEAESIIDSKKNGSSYYSPADQKGIDPINKSLPGKMGGTPKPKASHPTKVSPVKPSINEEEEESKKRKQEEKKEEALTDAMLDKLLEMMESNDQE